MARRSAAKASAERRTSSFGKPSADTLGIRDSSMSVCLCAGKRASMSRSAAATEPLVMASLLSSGSSAESHPEPQRAGQGPLVDDDRGGHVAERGARGVEHGDLL